MAATKEHARLLEYRQRRSNWKHWGPYLSERAWGTVREDYSEDGSAWTYFPHDHARSRAYRWNEDGLMGISERYQHLCFAVALWNGQDPILKERLFGLTGPEGNHGEDVKEVYFYLESTPTHSYMKFLYRYPQRAFPYRDLIETNARRSLRDSEYELPDTGVFADDRYFDVVTEYAKADQDDILIRLAVTNHAAEAALLHVLPQLWFRNTWSWGYDCGPLGQMSFKPVLEQKANGAIVTRHPATGTYHLYAEEHGGCSPELLFTENETNTERLFGAPNTSPYVKDAFHRYLVGGETEAVSPAQRGTKAAAHYEVRLEPSETRTVRLRLCQGERASPFQAFGDIFAERQTEADAFYASVQPAHLGEDERRVQRQALAGMLLSKQLYYYDLPQWLAGDPAQPAPPAARRRGRNHSWTHLHNFDLLSMPDKWEYPWYAAWDLAFHCLPLALVDPDFAKRQLELLTREWYMDPNGQLPAYEWAFGDANPPVHAWAALRIYQIDAEATGHRDRGFLEGVFHKLLLNFTWWVNRKDAEGRNVFEGGFLGLDNISVFDRSRPLPTGGRLSQSDGTAWMGFYCVSMLEIALELARKNAAYEDIATKFFEHYLRIAHAINHCGGTGHSLWHEQDGIFYDALNLPSGEVVPLKVRSLVGLMPLIAVTALEPEVYEILPAFARRVEWFLHHRPELAGKMAELHEHGSHESRLMSFLSREQLVSVLSYLLDEEEFLSPYGIRSVSKYHEKHPYTFRVNGSKGFTVAYEPAESSSGLFGGNSNWRGPVWFPINYLIIEALQRYHRYYGDDCRVECPTGSGRLATLGEVAGDLSSRLTGLFLINTRGERPAHGGHPLFRDDPRWRDHILYYEYFHGDSGAGLGASHQTGWTGLVATLLQETSGAR